jgi:hypothetical protein
VETAGADGSFFARLARPRYLAVPNSVSVSFGAGSHTRDGLRNLPATKCEKCVEKKAKRK